MGEYTINLLGNCCELFIILFFLDGRYSPKYKKTTHIVFCIVFTILQFLNTSIFLSKSQLVILGALVYTFLVMLLYKIKWYYRILFSFFIYIVNALSETIVGMMLAVIFKVDISYTQESILIFAGCTLTSKFLSYIIVLFTKKRWFKTDSEAIKQNIVLAILLPFSSFLVLVVLLRCCYQINEYSFQIFVLVSSVILVFANIAVFYIINKLNELIETKEKLLFAELHINNQVLHYQELNKHQNELRIFRHDIKNRLFSLMALVKDGKSDKALQIMEKNLNWLEEMNSNIINSGNPVVDAIIQAKLHVAKDKGISFQISTKLAEEIKMDELELGIVLGNALDNAIEAVEKSSEKGKKNINLTLMSTDNRISISISNPVDEDINTEKLITSKSDKEKHGYGIKSIKAIAQKHDGVVSFLCDNRVFNISINMANK